MPMLHAAAAVNFQLPVRAEMMMNKRNRPAEIYLSLISAD